MMPTIPGGAPRAGAAAVGNHIDSGGGCPAGNQARLFFCSVLLLIVFLGGAASVAAQEAGEDTAKGPGQADMLSLAEWNRERLGIQKNGMYVLGSWALTNFAVSGYYMTKTSDRTFFFHQMNVFWNVVNLGIATFGYFGAAGSPLDLGLEQTVEEYRSFGRILGINAALDVGYVMTGFFLKSRGKKSDSYSERLIGYGNSLILQGSFLFVFDVALAYINQYSLSRMADAYSLDISAIPWGLSARFSW
jgi:hypothetical protein